VVVKWKLPLEEHAAAAEAMLLAWEQQMLAVCAPQHLPAEVMSAFLRAARRDRLTAEEAREAIRDLLALPFQLSAVTPLAARAVTIAQQQNQRVYDCLYVALADQEGIGLWTADRRLYNALHVHYGCVQWIGDYPVP
jgi:predicted nucleic acid-binding protein